MWIYAFLLQKRTKIIFTHFLRKGITYFWRYKESYSFLSVLQEGGGPPPAPSPAPAPAPAPSPAPSPAPAPPSCHLMSQSWQTISFLHSLPPSLHWANSAQHYFCLHWTAHPSRVWRNSIYSLLWSSFISTCPPLHITKDFFFFL